MLRTRRRTFRALLVPVALLAVLFGSSLPAFAADDDSYDASISVSTPAVQPLFAARPQSLKW